MKVAAIVQARMGSRRLPGKVLLDLGGKTMLARVVERLRRARVLDEVLIATTDSDRDNAIVEECRRIPVEVFRGQEDDVLDRYHAAAEAIAADVVVRITSDCPLIDPEVTNRTVQEFLAKQPDYASNVLVRTYPRGLDTEVMTVQALQRAWSEAREPYERVHVTPYLYGHPEKFKLLSVTGATDHSRHRWTVDTPEDLQLVRAIYEQLGGQDFLWRDVLEVVEGQPALAELNRGVMQKALHEC